MVCTDILQLLACRLLAGLPSSAHLRRPHFKFCAWWSSSGLSASPHSWVVWLSFPHSHYPTIFIRPSWYSTSHIATDASTITSGIVGKATSYLLWAQCLYDVCMKVANNPKFSCLPHARCVMFKLRHSALCFSALYWLSLVLMYFQFYPIVIYVRPSDQVYTCRLWFMMHHVLNVGYLSPFHFNYRLIETLYACDHHTFLVFHDSMNSRISQILKT